MCQHIAAPVNNTPALLQIIPATKSLAGRVTQYKQPAKGHRQWIIVRFRRVGFFFFFCSYLCIAPVLRHGCIRLRRRRRTGYPGYRHGAAARCTGHDGGRRGSRCGRAHRSRRTRRHRHSGCLLRRALTHHWQPETAKRKRILLVYIFKN